MFKWANNIWLVLRMTIVDSDYDFRNFQQAARSSAAFQSPLIGRWLFGFPCSLLSTTSTVLDMADATPPPPPPPPEESSPPPPLPPVASGSPTDFLKGVVGKKVVVRLTSGVDYKGIYCDSISNATETSDGVAHCLLPTQVFSPVSMAT